MSIEVYTDEPTKLHGTLLDAFGRQKTSDPVTLFDSQQQYDSSPLLWEEITIGSASTAHLPNEATASMVTTTASGDRVIRQTRQYFRYQPGKSQLVLTTFAMSAADANLTQRVGYFDKENGIFLELAGTALRVVRRSKTTGSIVDTAVEQADWNLDAASYLDISKAQIFYVSMEWLGVGSVQCGFVIDGALKPVHQFNNANNLSTTYMTTANLPVRYEIENTGTTSGSNTLRAVCCSVIAEGGFESDRGYPFCASNGITTKAIGPRKPVISIRPKATFNSVTNRGQFLVSGVEAFVNTTPCFVEVVYNGTLTSASYGSVNSSSLIEYDVDATSISGGIVVNAFYVQAANAQGNQPALPGQGGLGLGGELPLALDISASAATTLSVVATSFSASAGVSATIFWQELR